MNLLSAKPFILKTLAMLCTCFLLSVKIIQPADQWYEETKAEILKQSILKSDSLSVLFNSDSSKKKEFYFSVGHKFMTKSYKKGLQSSESYFSKDGNFELRRELCENGVISFEGIAYKTSLYGPFTRFYCNGKIQQQGFRYQSETIGTWKTFNESGTLVDESDFKYHSLLNSLPQITK